MLLSLVLLSATLAYANTHNNFFLIKIINRWLRWVIFSIFFCLLYQYLAIPESRPDWLLYITGFLLFALIETIFNWMEISALSHSEVSLFPKFRLNEEGDEWPSHKRYLEVKDWLRDNDFVHLQSLKSTLIEDIHIRTSIYEEKTSRTRCQVLFLPQRNGSFAMCYVFTNYTQDDMRYITDNMFVPYAGFYPENWLLVRKPTAHTIDAVHKIHKKRIKNAVKEFIYLEKEPIEDINNQQKYLETINTESGFLNAPNLHEEHGKISATGRYRMWKQIWLMNYFGIAINT